MVSFTKRETPITKAEAYPKSPTIFDKTFNCFFNGVKSVSSSSSPSSFFLPAEFINCLFWPSKVLSPTAATTMLPKPSTTWEPEKTKGQVYLCPFVSKLLTFHMISDSPVTGDSSIPTLASPKTNPSTLIISPILNLIISPTSISSMEISFSNPSRITKTFLSLFSLFNFKNCSCFW